MAELIDIQGLFAGVLETPEQMARKQLERNVGLFGNNSWAGALGELRTNTQNNLRGFVQQAGSAVNPDFDVRTPDQKFRAAVNAIDPASETAEEQYVAAAKEFAPDKLPALMQNIRTRRIEDERLGREESAEARAVSAESRAVTNEGRLQEAHESAQAGRALRQTIEALDLTDSVQARQSVADKKRYLTGSTIAGRGEGYAERIAAMTPAEVNAEFARVEQIEGQVAKGLRTSITAQLGPDHDAVGLLSDMPASQLQAINSAIASGLITPDTQVVGDAKNGWKMVVKDSLNPSQSTTVDIIQGTGEPPKPRALQPLTGAAREAVDKAVDSIDISNAPFWNGKVADENGNKFTAEELVERRAGDFFQRTKLTELELTDRVRAAAADLEGLPAESKSYEGINSILDKHFPFAQTASSLIDSSL